jgi:hypothetical protein
MAWQTECIVMVRHMVGDLTEPYTYSDNRLEELFLVCAQMVITEVIFNETYTIDVDEVTLTPDPTDREADTRNDNFINLVCLKCACFIDQCETRKAAQTGGLIKDMNVTVDFRGSLQGRISILKEGWCKAYAEAVLQYKTNRYQVAGAAIVAPFRIDGGDYTRYYR